MRVSLPIQNQKTDFGTRDYMVVIEYFRVGVTLGDSKENGRAGV
ncbi:hypothetical protein [Bartonella phoceensis]|nr:hypothetical protein [Bartonella phoceensis]